MADETPAWLTKLRQELILRRKLLGLGQRELAQKMGITQSGVSELENRDPFNVSVLILERWVHALHGNMVVTGSFDEIVVTIPAHTLNVRSNRGC